MENKQRIRAILVSIPRGAMERHREQLANALVLASALIAVVATFLLPPSLQAQTQAQPNGIDPAILAKANAGDANAQFNIGVLYDNGQGVAQDYKQAAAWYRKAAEQGRAEAQLNLGVMYARGDGVPKDYAEAVRWSRKAADQGNAGAQYNLGQDYIFGTGVPKDETKAVFWYRKAAEQGEAKAQFELGIA
jgi:TPR repeat protein